jgi:hypothetical protein
MVARWSPWRCRSGPKRGNLTEEVREKDEIKGRT